MTETEQDAGLPEPTIQIEDAGPARKRIRVEIPAERIAARIGDSYESLQAEATLPGFRRGRAPMRLLQKRFGGDVRKETLSQVLGETYQEAIESNDLRVLGEPDIKDQENLELPEDGPLNFEVEIEVAPDVELPDLAGIEIDKPLLEVEDEQVNAEIERMCEIYGQAKPVEESQLNDFATADIKITDKDGEVLEEQAGQHVFIPGEQREFKGVVAGILIDGLGKQLEGKKVGDTITLEATGPSGHENEKLRDQELKIELRLTGLQRHTPLSVEELVETAGMESEEELRDLLRQRLEGQTEAEQQRAMADQVIDVLMEKVDIELPEGLSAQQAQRVTQRRAMEMMYRGSTPQEIEENLAELRAGSEQEARAELKQFFILDAVARKLDVEVTEGEVNGRIAQMAAQQGHRPEKQREEMARSGQIDQLFVQLREEKALAALLEEAKINEVSAEEWRKRQEKEEKKEAEGAGD